MERSVLQGLAVFRWAAWAWMAVVLAVSRDDLARPGLAVLLVAGGLVVEVVDQPVACQSPPVARAGPHRRPEKTVENHVRNILGKLHLSRKQELIRYAVEHGLE